MINHDPYLYRDAMHAALEADAKQWRRDRRERIATAALIGILSDPDSEWGLLASPTMQSSTRTN